MKEFFQITCMALLLFLAGCKNETPGYNGGGDDPTPDDTEMGYLVTSGLTVSVADDEVISTTTGGSVSQPAKPADRTAKAQETTRASSPLADAGDDYKVTIRNVKTSETLNYTYGDLKKTENQKIPLAPGSYTIAAESPDYAAYMAGANYAAWESPVFAGSVTKTIVKKTETTVNDLVCSLANIKTTVILSADLQSMFLLDAQATEALPALKVTLSVGENKLVFNRAESNNEARGYFKAVEASNTIKVELEGSYNKSPGDAAPVYVPVKWTREITDCKAGQWRKISIKILNATQGNIQFQMTVENWVYDQKIDVDVMQLFAFAGEETIPDEDLSDPNSPVVTLDGRDIAQGYTISKSMFDEELGKWSENLKAVITPQADASVRTAKLVFSSDNAELLAALDGAGYVNGTIPVWPQNDDLLAYLVMKEAASTHILAGTVKDAGMSGLFGYKGTHKVKFVVTDTKGRTSYTNLTVKVTEGGSVGTGPEVKWTNKAGTVSYDFGTRYKITKLSDSEADPEVKITVTSQTGIVGFSVDINSTTLTPEELQGLGLSTHMDLVNPGSFEGPLTNLGFPTGSAVAGKKSLTFDISSFMPMLTVLGPGNSDFKLTVIDASGSVSKTIQLYVP